jgi:hypothetical protein
VCGGQVAVELGVQQEAEHVGVDGVHGQGSRRKK